MRDHASRSGPPRPTVEVGRAEAVYAFYGPGRRREGFTAAVLRLATLLYAPRVVVDPGTVDRLHELCSEGVGIVVAANHPSAHDPLVLASTLWDRRIRFLSGGTGLTKDPLFRGPLRPLFEYTGTVPVFRGKNHPGIPQSVHDAAAARLIALCVDLLRRGRPVLTFVEGTNSAADDLHTLHLGSVKKGVGLMVTGVRGSGRPVAVLPLALAYHGREHSRTPPRRAVAVAGPPVRWADPDPVPTVDEVRAAVRDGIDSALGRAWELRER